MSEQNIQRILRIDSSARQADSVSRAIGDEVVQRLLAEHPNAEVEHIDLADGVGHIDGHWVGANFTAEDQRSAEQKQHQQYSDGAIAALKAADAIVLTAPIYNFSVPSVLKAWIDHVCRAGLTFRYTEDGPKGLLEDRPVYLVMASGGVPFGSPVDFASGYLKQVFGFVGIDDVRLIGAEGVAMDSEGAKLGALAELGRWLPDAAGAVA